MSKKSTPAPARKQAAKPCADHPKSLLACAVCGWAVPGASVTRPTTKYGWRKP